MWGEGVMMASLGEVAPSTTQRLGRVTSEVVLMGVRASTVVIGKVVVPPSYRVGLVLYSIVYAL